MIHFLSPRFLQKSLAFVFGAVFLVSCHSTKDLAYVPNPQENEIHEAFVKDKVSDLIVQYQKHPDHAQRIADFMLFEHDYDQESYADLLRYSSQAHDIDSLRPSFEALVLERQRNILESLSDESVNELAVYYRTHPIEQDFLAEAFNQTLLSDLDAYTYYDLHCLHYAFAETDLQERIDSIYLERKDALYDVIDKQTSDYCREETRLCKDLSRQCLDEVEAYALAVNGRVLETMLDDDLPESGSSIVDLYDRSFHTVVNVDTIRSIIDSHLELLTSAVNEGRKSYLHELMPEMSLRGYEQSRVTSGYFQYCPRCPLSPLKKISEIQNKTDWVGMGMTAASLFSGPIVGALIDLVDLGRSAINADEDAEKIKPYITQASRTMESDAHRQLSDIISKAFGSCQQALEASQENFKYAIYENY